VFRNILENAVRYSPEGGLIVIRGEARATDVVLSIADEGIGISPEDLIPIFENTSRARCGGLPRGGTGLGLPVSRRSSRLTAGESGSTASWEKARQCSFRSHGCVLESNHPADTSRGYPATGDTT